ncbi:MAG: rod shape-determining protein MreC [Ruminococcus sp.]
MKDFFANKSIRVLAVTLAVILVLSIMGYAGSPVISTVTGFLTNGLSQVTYALSSAATQKTYEQLASENAELKEENADLRTQLVDYYDVKSENQRLWKYYNIKKENPDYTLVPATVIRRDSGDDYYSFTLDAGTAMGVHLQDVVVTENGLVGFISSINGANCKVTTILSPDIQAGAIDKKTNDVGVISGRAGYCDKNLTTLTKINTTGTIKVGDMIVTSGIGGIYPENIIVGKVKSTEFNQDDATKYAVIEPYEDIKTVTDVVIITDFKNKGEIKTQSQKD